MTVRPLRSSHSFRCSAAMRANAIVLGKMVGAHPNNASGLAVLGSWKKRAETGAKQRIITRRLLPSSPTQPVAPTIFLQNVDEWRQRRCGIVAGADARRGMPNAPSPLIPWRGPTTPREHTGSPRPSGRCSQSRSEQRRIPESPGMVYAKLGDKRTQHSSEKGDFAGAGLTAAKDSQAALQDLVRHS